MALTGAPDPPSKLLFRVCDRRRVGRRCGELKGEESENWITFSLCLVKITFIFISNCFYILDEDVPLCFTCFISLKL